MRTKFTRSIARCAAAIHAIALVLALPGCGAGYVIDGSVIAGDLAGVSFGASDAAPLPGDPVAGALVNVYRDATQPNQRLVASGRSGADGSITIPLQEFGAGWMDEMWLIEAQRPGFETIRSVVHLPPGGDRKRITIVLSPGTATPTLDESSLWEEYRRYR